MDYEKAYKEALERAKEFQKSKDGLCVLTAESIFPELKESEDEKIRKALLESFEYQIKESRPDKEWLYGVKLKEIVAWLEKQGESYTKKDVDDAYLKGVTNTKNEIEKQYEANYQIRKDIATFIFNYRGDIKDRAKWMDYLGIKVSFVEKQGEQKVPSVEFKAKDWYVSNVDGKIHNANIGSKKQGEEKSKDETKNNSENYCEDCINRKGCINCENGNLKETIKPAQEIINDWHKKQGTSVKTTAYGTFGKCGVVEYVYILDYSTGRVIVAKHDVQETIETLFKKLGLKESQCHYMVSSDVLSIEYINF